MQKYFQLSLFTLLMVFVDSQIHSVSSRADDASDYFTALQKPENRSPQKQAELKKNAESAKLNEINRLNREDRKKAEEQISRGPKDSALSSSPSTEMDDEDEKATGTHVTSQKPSSKKPSAEASIPTKSAPTQVKLGDYREELGAPLSSPSPIPSPKKSH